jgi:hypothetical protein
MGSFCPLIKKDCVESKCKFWTHLYGKNPQSDSLIDKFGCAIEFLPILLVENAQVIRQAAASTDKVANQVNASNMILEKARTDAADRRLLTNGPV